MKDEAFPVVPLRRDQVETLSDRTGFIYCSGVAWCVVEEPRDLLLALCDVENLVVRRILDKSL